MKKIIILILLAGCSTTTNITEQSNDASVSVDKTVEVMDVPGTGGTASTQSDSGPVGGQEGAEVDAGINPEPEEDSGSEEPQDAGKDTGPNLPEDSGAGTGGTAGEGGAGGEAGSAGVGGIGGQGGVGGVGGQAGMGGVGGSDPCEGVVCDDGDDFCTHDKCVDGECVFYPMGEGLGCGGGKCRDGECCAGCWTGSECVDGDILTECGSFGLLCEDCVDGNPCTEDICKENGGCSHPAVLQYSECPEGQCFSTTCYAVGDEDERCRSGSQCDADDLVCYSNYCKPCGGSNEYCCQPSFPITACESDDLVCVDNKCKACGGKNQPCCAGNKCDPAYLFNEMLCIGGICKCGGDGQPCCAGYTKCEAGLKCYTGSGYCAPY